MQKKCQHIFLISGLIFSSSIVAAPSIEDTHPKFVHPIITLTGGAAFNSDAGQSNNFSASSTTFSSYHYQPNKTNQVVSIFGALIGAEFLINSAWSTQVGLSYYQAGNLHIKGIVTQGVEPFLDQYSYAYTIQSRQLLIESKWLYNLQYFHPYLLGGIGAAFNNTQNFSVDIQPPFTTFSHQFSNRSISSFTYVLGLGAEMTITQHLRFGLGYRFTDLGNASTGNSTIGSITTTNSLTQMHLYTNEVLAQFTCTSLLVFSR